ncbi:hypothetical protein BKA65DRAFT_184447 [Rhexocercosporidium sp. MPI-PUGE-AT-0058]|nr:hypothetical protein BKA65DRAFT_184447 [Rhexocercosporidium sp. MPI-PUGE-AT-0058]
MLCKSEVHDSPNHCSGHRLPALMRCTHPENCQSATLSYWDCNDSLFSLNATLDERVNESKGSAAQTGTNDDSCETRDGNLMLALIDELKAQLAGADTFNCTSRPLSAPVDRAARYSECQWTCSMENTGVRINLGYDSDFQSGCVSRANLDSNLARRHSGTSEWILSDGSFVQWLTQSNGGVLWLSGLPGAGKSMLTSTIIHHLELNRVPGELVAFYFVDEYYKGISASKAILWTMLEQILLRDGLGDFGNHLWPLLRDLASNHDELSIQRMSSYLCRIRSCLRLDETLYLLLDGLDNITENPHERELVLHLVEYVTLSDPSHRIKCFFSSNENLLQNEIGKEVYRIDLDTHPLLRRDMSQYVRCSLDGLRPSIDIKDIRSLTDQLVRLADGVFLFVQLVIDAMALDLGHGISLMVAAEQVAAEPKKADEKISLTYRKILAQIESCNQKVVFALLRWVMHAARPLGSHELLDAIYKETGTQLSASEVHSHSAGLLETRGEKVGFVHFSARRYLRHGMIKNWGEISAEAHELMAHVCLEVLSPELLLQTLEMGPESASDIANPMLREGLVRYAMRYWIYHYRQAESRSAYIAGLLHSRLGKDFRRLSHCSYHPWATARGSKDAKSIFDTVQSSIVDAMLSVSSRFGFAKLAKLELDMGAHVNLSANPEALSPLMLAVMHGHLEISRLLLDYGADVNLPAASGDSPLLVASEHGFLDIVRLLLASGAEINFTSSSGQSPLHMAVEYGYFGITQDLLEAGANINHSSLWGYSPLMLAATYNYFEIARLLLNSGANVNNVSCSGETALAMAIRQNHPKVIHLLLEYGADTTKCASCGNSPLMMAAKYGHLETTRLLLAVGADAMASSTSGKTAFIYAMQNRRFDVASLLLKHDMERAHMMGTSPLLTASRELYLTVTASCPPHNTFDGIQITYELMPLNRSTTLCTHPITINGKSISIIEIPAATDLLQERSTVHSIVRWFPGDHLYAVLQEVAEHGIEDVGKLLAIAGNDTDVMDGIISLSALFSGLKI